ncbi:MAG: hypothetical protein J6Y37_05695 [Paludibacteraceae bacterium]|nr:hypothetical protein [Paludibacteraceae bacterium]
MILFVFITYAKNHGGEKKVTDASGYTCGRMPQNNPKNLHKFHSFE